MCGHPSQCKLAFSQVWIVQCSSSQNVFEKSLEKAKRRIEREKKAKIKEEKLKVADVNGKENS